MAENPNPIFFIPTEGEKKLLNGATSEVMKLVSTLGVYKSLLKKEIGVDPVYGEPKFKEIFAETAIRVYIEKPNEIARSDEQGMELFREARAEIAKVELDTAGIQPKEGDVIHVWDVDWDVIRVEPGGYFGDAQFFTTVVFELRRRIVFIPERRQ